MWRLVLGGYRKTEEDISSPSSSSLSTSSGSSTSASSEAALKHWHSYRVPGRDRGSDECDSGGDQVEEEEAFTLTAAKQAKDGSGAYVFVQFPAYSEALDEMVDPRGGLRYPPVNVKVIPSPRYIFILGSEYVGPLILSPEPQVVTCVRGGNGLLPVTFTFNVEDNLRKYLFWPPPQPGQSIAPEIREKAVKNLILPTDNQKELSMFPSLRSPSSSPL